jgi:hypothetical protein
MQSAVMTVYIAAINLRLPISPPDILKAPVLESKGRAVLDEKKDQLHPLYVARPMMRQTTPTTMYGNIFLRNLS